MGIFVKKKGDAGSGPFPPNPTSRPWREKALRLADVERAEAEKCQFCVYSVTISPPQEESFFCDYKKNHLQASAVKVAGIVCTQWNS